MWHYTLQSQCARPVFLAGHPPHGPKPGAQRQARVLENRARRHRSLIIALPTPQQAPPAGPSSPPSTAGTHKTLWPAQLHQILATRLLSGKTPLKLLQRPRVVLHSPACYMLGSRESSAYPECPIRCRVKMSCFGRLAGAPWRGPRRLGMTLRVSAADPFGQLTGASVFVGGIALVKSRS